MSDPRGSGFDPYAYLHDTGEHAASYLPAENDDDAPRSSAQRPPTDSGAPGPAAAAPGGLDLAGELPPTMTRRQLREARERAAKARGGAGAQAASPDPVASPDPAAPADPAADSAPLVPRVSVTATSTRPSPDSPWDTALATPPGDRDRAESRERKRSRAHPGLVAAAVIAGIAALAAVVVFIVLPLVRPDAAEAPTSPPTASDDTEGRTSPLLDLLPTEVTGGQYAGGEEPTGEEPTGEEPTGEEPTGEGPAPIIYRLVAPGYVDNPQAPEDALESVVGQFSGGAELVTLTAARFGTSDAALADATARKDTLGAVVDEGVVFPDEDRGYYWIFNTDGLVTIVWTDGELGSYWIVSEDAASALDFYQGLEF